MNEREKRRVGSRARESANNVTTLNQNKLKTETLSSLSFFDEKKNEIPFLPRFAPFSLFGIFLVDSSSWLQPAVVFLVVSAYLCYYFDVEWRQRVRDVKPKCHDIFYSFDFHESFSRISFIRFECAQ